MICARYMISRVCLARGECALSFLLRWLLERKGWVMFGVAILLYVVLLVLWFGFDIFWQWGFAMTTALAIAGPLLAGSKD